MIRYVFKLSNRDGAIVQESTYHAGPYDGPRVFGDFAADCGGVEFKDGDVIEIRVFKERSCSLPLPLGEAPTPVKGGPNCEVCPEHVKEVCECW
jgi:hypothetical protein